MVHAPTKPTSSKRKRGCPKGGWPKKEMKQVEAEGMENEVEEAEAMKVYY